MSSTLDLYMMIVENDEQMENSYKFRAKQFATSICEKSEEEQLKHIEELYKCIGFWIVDATLEQIRQHTCYTSVKNDVDKYFSNMFSNINKNKNNNLDDNKEMYNNTNNNTINTKNESNDSNDDSKISLLQATIIHNKRIAEIKASRELSRDLLDQSAINLNFKNKDNIENNNNNNQATIQFNKKVEDLFYRYNLKLGKNLVAAYCNYTKSQILDPTILGGKINEPCPACKFRFNLDIYLDDHTDNVIEILIRKYKIKHTPIQLPPKRISTGRYCIDEPALKIFELENLFD